MLLCVIPGAILLTLDIFEMVAQVYIIANSFYRTIAFAYDRSRAVNSRKGSMVLGLVLSFWSAIF